MPATVMSRSKPVTHSQVSLGKPKLHYTSPTSLHVNPYGLEVVDSIVWQGWEPGREYTRNIILKNVKVKTQKIKYVVPSTRFFSTLYPKPIVLSAGTSFSLPITFRPLEKVSYQDKVEFHTKDGSFDVSIKAILPQIDIDVIDEMNFNMCAAKDTVETEIQVSNTGDLETIVHWDVGLPFCIEPRESVIKPGMSASFQARFKPLTATVHEAAAVCFYGPNKSQSKVTRLRGIGKYPHIIVSSPGQIATAIDKDNLEAVAEFDQAEVNSQVQKWVELHNLSPVRAPYKVEHPSGLSRLDTVFHCPQKNGVVPPMASVKIPIVYNPNTVDTTSIDYFHVVAIGNVSKSVIKCIGSSKGPILQLSSRVVNFKQIDIGETATRTIELYNGSDVEAVYEFMIDCNESVFKFERVCGVLKPEAYQTIILKFQPTHPINYHRQVTCMVHNQGPIFLDLLGTCHSELVKPALIQPIHLERYKCHVDRGLSLYPPEQLNELLKHGKLELDDGGAVMVPEQSEALESPVKPMPSLSPLEEYFNDGFHCDVVNFVPHVSLDTNVADFGNCQNLRIIEDKVINLTNHTRGKVTVQWIGDTNRTYSVVPATMDIPPQKSGTFSVSFKPNAPNQFYGAELECYVYYKSLRDFRLVEDTTHCPPWCLTLACAGHTFMPNNMTFLPKFTLDSTQLVFPAVNAKEAAFRTLLMRNTGTTPIMCNIQRDKNSTFSVKPDMTLLKGEHQIFVVKFAPDSVQRYKEKLTMRLNDNSKYDQELEVVGSAEAPEVLLDTDGVMVFKPTCVGMASHRTYTIKNISRIPLRFEWMLTHTDRKLLTVRPESGIIQPNENQSQVWSFIPRSNEKYVMKPCLIVWGQGFSSNSSGGKKKQFTVRSVGEGSIGDIKVDKAYIDFGDIVVGSSANQHISIFNNSICSLQYKLLIEQAIDSPYAVDFKDDKIALELEKTEGIIPARSKHTLMATVRPLRRVNYQFTISYQLLTPEGDDTDGSIKEPQHLCHILTTGVFPTMAITDARCYGSAIGISKKQLWDLFSLDNLNVCLDSDPSTAELMYSVATRHSHCRRPPVYTRAVLDVNFSAAPVGSEPCIVNLMFENTGTVPTEWATLFPSDLHLELEYWAETGEFDEDELHEMKVMDNQLFSIEPKKGQLQPGECKTVTFTYRHTMAGTDRLPVLLKLARGREILLNFVGVTVNLERRYIHFPSNKHMFTPVPVGEKISPKQMYDLYNGGALPVKFSFDLTPLELLRQENFDQPILECLNPEGEIMPGRSVAVEWRFSPVEAKTYMVDVPIHVSEGDTAIVTFTGVGYDKRVLGETMPMTDQHDISGVPSVQSVPIPGQLTYLSQERISFSNMPLFCRARRMVFLTNVSKERDVSFEWHVTSQADSKYLSISPVSGELRAGETKMCRVVFMACGVPSFYDLDLVCEVTDETEMSLYREKLEEWEDEQMRQQYEFTITEDDLDADKRIPNVVEITDRPRSGRLQSLDDSKSAASDVELTKYKTLPPIKQLSVDEMIANDKKQEKKIEDLWEKPTRPSPFLLHLGLTARTHDINDFQANFSEDYRSFYIDRLLSEKSLVKEETISSPTSDMVCTEAEADVLSGVLNNVIRGLLDDTYFHEAIRKVAREPVPYFCQIRELPSQEPSDLGESVPISPVPASLLSAGKASERSTPVSVVSSSKSLDSLPGEMDMKLTPRHTQEEMRRARSAETKLQHRRGVKKMPEFGNTAESMMENTILNILSEALAGEFSVTARPRFIALPKRPTSSQSKLSKA
ncbi:hypothetical protein ScPMuIL_016753 [Solemya velum]